MNRFRLLFVAPTLLLLLASVWPLVDGSRTLFMRDVFNTHLEMKWMQAEAMRGGSVPLIDDLRSGGQAHVGNPNTVPLYPDNLLYLVLPFFWVFNAHFWIHLLVAPFSMYWLGREWGLRRDAAWASGVVYATCGFYLSNYNFYNLVAGVTLAPALAAALIRSTADRSRHWGFAATALIWCLLLLAGDPIVAALAAALGGGSMIVLGGGGGRWRRGLAAGLLGSVLAAPQIVEFLRVLPLTFRGLWGYSLESVLTASWNPRTLLDWVLPLPYGEPGFDFWGLHLFGGLPPLYYSFYPGMIATAFFLWSGVPRSRAARLAWGWMLIGIFLALGAHNPPLAWLLESTGIQLVRFPVKFWLLVAIGGSLLCGLGVERWLRSGESGGNGGRSGHRGVAAFAALAAMAWVGALWIRGAEGAGAMLRRWIPMRFDASFVDAERARWAGLAVLVVALLTVSAGVVHLGARRSRSLALAALLVLHAASQLVMLRPLLPTDEVAVYRERHRALDRIPAGSRVVHGRAGSLFGRAAIDPSRYPDRSFVWLQRQTFAELYPTAGWLGGLRYDLVLSPEGLDSFRTRAAVQAVQNLPDEARLRLLETWGVDYLVLDRTLPAPLDERVELVTGFDNSLGEPLYVYRVREPLPSSRFVGRILPQRALTDELRTLTDPTHDAAGAVVVPRPTAPLLASSGTLEVVEDERERWRGRVRSEGGGAVVLQRSNLPILKATVDGEPVEVLDADLYRLAIPVPPGERDVVLEVDRTPWRVSWFVSLLGLLELGLVFRRLRSGAVAPIRTGRTSG